MNTPIRELKYDQLSAAVYADNDSLGRAAAEQAAMALRAAIAARGQANAILATGNSQLTTLAALREADVDWSKVNLFHMDEYIGLTEQHPASFRRFLHERLVDAVRPAAFYGVQGDASIIPDECQRYADLLLRYPADLCCLGIGENGHLAFNDPPYADFHDPVWVKVVELDQKSRQQQGGEGQIGRAS